MTTDFTGIHVLASTPTERKAADLFVQEIEKRTGKAPDFTESVQEPCMIFCEDNAFTDKDSYSIDVKGGTITVRGQGIRALVYGYAMFLRKTEYKDGKITLTCSIDGTYVPDKKIRGHQLGYRPLNNTYEAWSLEQYRRYYLDMMYFGSNTVEHIPQLEKVDVNALMQYSQNELFFAAAEIADTLDLDVSLWYPNDHLSVEESIAVRKAVFEKAPRLNVVFTPGGDPGDYPGDEFVDRVCKISEALKSVCPQAEFWPSAQAPHKYPTWGDDFIAKMEALPKEIDGVITGPNRAFPIDVLRRKLPKEYPIRLYPDITHNVRCEYPVHALQDDWHYALATTLSRESINPRPEEYRLIHRLTRRYVVGSVSYSEGANDDVNKMVWADMDFFPECDLYDTLLDYARLFMWELPAQQIADGILGLERNWVGDPAENPGIESTLHLFETLAQNYPCAEKNWRFCQLYFRACCDALVRRRRVFENALLKQAKVLLAKNDIAAAKEVLQTAFEPSYVALREKINALAGNLFEQIGMQLDVEHYGASHWERGATLETIDLPVTDRAFYLNRLEYALSLPQPEQSDFVRGLLHRNTVRTDEYYFSFAEHGFDVLGEKQTPDFYMDFQGDSPTTNDGSIPMCQLKLYDHFNFRCKLAGFIPGQDYKLRVSYAADKNERVTQHTVKLDGKVIYCGAQYGGEKDEAFDKAYLAPGTETATYLLPASCFENGCAELVIEEPTVGVKLSEFWVLRA